MSENIVVVNENFNYRFYRGQEILFNTTVGKNSDHYKTAASERISQDPSKIALLIEQKKFICFESHQLCPFICFMRAS